MEGGMAESILNYKKDPKEDYYGILGCDKSSDEEQGGSLIDSGHFFGSVLGPFFGPVVGSLFGPVVGLLL